MIIIMTIIALESDHDCDQGVGALMICYEDCFSDYYDDYDGWLTIIPPIAKIILIILIVMKERTLDFACMQRILKLFFCHAIVICLPTDE